MHGTRGLRGRRYTSIAFLLLSTIVLIYAVSGPRSITIRLGINERLVAVDIPANTYFFFGLALLSASIGVLIAIRGGVRKRTVSNVVDIPWKKAIYSPKQFRRDR
ncbi:hypothetical protein [Burkholderia aenigmatica]|uniref:hypothetical protein n=1 Tax=Burkholderia aenigmatica TaxID=2015348 RepID=UPI00264C86B5|nr:hypothetical protein [Burkholderia aenigmatica]MDN7880141.1 hypothetical protein [Burkholderia aenigmatica]